MRVINETVQTEGVTKAKAKRLAKKRIRWRMMEKHRGGMVIKVRVPMGPWRNEVKNPHSIHASSILRREYRAVGIYLGS